MPRRWEAGPFLGENCLHVLAVNGKERMLLKVIQMAVAHDKAAAAPKPKTGANMWKKAKKESNLGAEGSTKEPPVIEKLLGAFSEVPPRFPAGTPCLWVSVSLLTHLCDRMLCV